ncbi:MAG: type I methionyl aminopeptidase [bacterium]
MKSQREIELMRRAGRIVAQTLELIRESLRPGLKTKKLDALAEDFIRSRGADPAFKGYRGYPASICVSVNEQVVHGIPGDYALRNGDLVSVDVGVSVEGYNGDGAATFCIGEPAPEISRFMDTARRALDEGVRMMADGNRVGDISHAVQRTVEEGGYSVVRDLVGHGIGAKMHEEPQVPNYGAPGTGPLIRNGMTFAIEPMINFGKHGVRTLADGWTVVSEDGTLSCHFEHTVAATSGGPRILTLP